MAVGALLRGVDGAALEFDTFATGAISDQVNWQSSLPDYIVNASVALGASGVAAAVNATFDIVVNYSGDPQYQSVFTAAVARWAQIITADIPDYTSQNYGFIDDLVIDASITYIDGVGGILGQAAPDEFRIGSNLPGHGVMQFDSSDIAALYAGGTLSAVILHEMGHVLGLGTLWPTMGLTNSFGDYTGSHALDEYRALSGNYGAISIPLERGGGAGTAGAHWDEDTFDTELMTGFANGTTPMSRMTIGALEDMGYTVNYAAADPYTMRPGAADDYADILNDSTAPFGTLAVNSTATGSLEQTRDHDWFRVSLTAGVTYTVTLRGAQSGNGTLDDPYLRLHNDMGVLITDNDDADGTSLESTIVFTASYTGDYYIHAGAAADLSAGTYTVGITNNLAPTGITSTPLVVNEYAAAGTQIGTMTAQDADSTSFTYALLNNAGGRFAIDNLGRLTVASGLLLDFEQAAGHTITVRAIDDHGLYVDQSFAVTVTDVNPEFVVGDGANNMFVGGALADNLFGMGGNDRLEGGGGNDYLDGGAGSDILEGGTGDDAYFVDQVSDAVYENANEGTDTVYASTNYGLTANIENLVLQGTGDWIAVGNTDSNVIHGNAGNNLLNGDSGADALYGGAGNDSYFVENPGDVVIENSGEGTDTVYSIIDLTLAANVEVLVLAGTDNLQGYGNNLVNVLYGNTGNNILDGGTGADTMYGGDGNDAYFVDNAGDTVIEAANEGIDDVYSSAHFVLGANIEYLHLTGSADIQGYGNALDNILVGNSGANLLDGRGGVDTLYGYGGNDTFFFRAGQAAGDTVIDFDGNGAGAGDRLLFADFGIGASFNQVDATHWSIDYNGNTQHEIITFANAAAVHASDVSWM